ncbi:hypothetical protein CWI42_090900 [Ordospora colligata]|uniref:Uncharacterized protein n=1 Tax=Ordospora colligata OC4 TaxID=1354746 RepID=A0A0B2UIV4_9MICR|nr:uncharacterized protein M896_090900 [Ordospora colligata OC4]KHN69164.1 hypothetical protein M896_090900 [Ordospora colligata OC4]TBU14619.1 hypothetical protein CWI41_090900 [Ordospora colligata]TBU14813.1 hypothetical protein CWI40_090910 [Ordospora colligata]TBU18136.1 hypothetical protein CWI42_090900 [Ordospora colligata]
MNFEQLLNTLRRKYIVKRQSANTYSVSDNIKTINITESDYGIYDESYIQSLFNTSESVPVDFANIGRDDLTPNMDDARTFTADRHIKGSMMDSSTFMRYGSQNTAEDDDSGTNPLIKIDPITPSKNKKDSFEPDRDDYVPDRSNRFL